MKNTLTILIFGLFQISGISAMVLEQSEYIVSSNDPDVEIIIGGQVISGDLNEDLFVAAHANTISFVFPGDNVYRASRECLPGKLEITVDKLEDGEYHIVLFSHENDELKQFHIACDDDETE